MKGEDSIPSPRGVSQDALHAIKDSRGDEWAKGITQHIPAQKDSSP